MNPFALFAARLNRSSNGGNSNPHSDPFPPAPPMGRTVFRARRACLIHRVAGLLFCSLTVTAMGQNPQSIVFTKHNLSVSGPGSLRASTEADICIFCHAPHNTTGVGPLWNHALSAATYTPYSSSTLKATVGQPTGASKLCLSCHDGTVALGMVASRSTPIPMQIRRDHHSRRADPHRHRPFGASPHLIHLRCGSGDKARRVARSGHLGSGSAPGSERPAAMHLLSRPAQ